MSLMLTPNAIQALLNRVKEFRPVLQIVDKRIMKYDARYSNADWSKLILSDGVYWYHALLPTLKPQDIVKNNWAVKGSIVKIMGYSCDFIKDKKVLFVYDMKLLMSKVQIIGKPTIFRESAFTSREQLQVKPSLTSNAILDINGGNWNLQAVLQILKIRVIGYEPHCTRKRYQVTLSDGDQRLLATWDDSLAWRIENGQVVESTIIQLQGYLLIRGSPENCAKEIHIAGVHLLASKSEIIGDPKPLPLRPPRIAANNYEGIELGMALMLTSNAILALNYSDYSELRPVLQIVDIRQIGNALTTTERFRLVLSDGVHLQVAMLASQLNEKVMNDLAGKGSIVQLLEYECITVQNINIIIVLSMEIVQSQAEIVGHPKDLVNAGGVQQAAFTRPEDSVLLSALSDSPEVGMSSISLPQPLPMAPPQPLLQLRMCCYNCVSWISECICILLLLGCLSVIVLIGIHNASRDPITELEAMAIHCFSLTGDGTDPLTPCVANGNISVTFQARNPNTVVGFKHRYMYTLVSAFYEERLWSQSRVPRFSQGPKSSRNVTTYLVVDKWHVEYNSIQNQPDIILRVSVDARVKQNSRMSIEQELRWFNLTCLVNVSMPTTFAAGRMLGKTCSKSVEPSKDHARLNNTRVV